MMRMQKWYLYACNPIDDWRGWRPLIRGSHDVSIDQQLVGAVVSHLMTAFSAIGWQGDVRWYMSAVPDPKNPPGSYLVVAVKQAHAGDTFIACTRELPWLAEGSPVNMDMPVVVLIPELD